MPVPWLAIAVIASAALGAYSAYAQGQAQSKMAAYNALIARQNAELARKQMAIAKTEKEIIEARHRREAEKTLAAQRAGWAKAGVSMEGTPLIVAAESMSEAELDALAIRYASTVEQSQILAQAAGYEQQAQLERMRGRAARTAGYLGVGTSLLGGVERWIAPKDAPKTVKA